VYYSCNKNKHQYTTGFILTWGGIIDFRPVDERICIVRMKGRFHTHSLICAHDSIEIKKGYEKR
jgi:hypothetical protein